MVGVSAAQLTRIEQGKKPATPPLHLRILAELNFGPKEFDEILKDSPEGWLARRLVIGTTDAYQLSAILRRGREEARLSLESLATKTNVGVARLEAMESGQLKPSPALLVDLVRAWGLPPDRLQHMIPESRASESEFAEQFLASLLEHAGFRVTKSKGSDMVTAELGGSWSLNFKATLTRRKPQDGESI